MKSLIAKHRTVWSDKFFATSAIIGFLLFTSSLFVNYSAIKYATLEAGNSVTDILLENLPVINTDIIFQRGRAPIRNFYRNSACMRTKNDPLYS